MPIKSRVLSDRTDVLTIWDNYERHSAELTALGATESDLAELRRAAEAVDVEEAAYAQSSGRNPAFNRADLAGITEPYTCCNGWTIRPPSKPSIRWASMAILKVTGGQEPGDNVGLLNALVAGLHVLRLCGDGRAGEAMQLVSSPSRLAESLPDLLDAFSGQTLDAIAVDYTTLIGVEKKTPARAIYETLLSRIRAKYSASTTTPSSPSTSAPEPSTSSHPGPNT